MAYDLTDPLVIGISSRALFDLEKENAIFEQEGLEAYAAYQLAHEKEVLPRGPAFSLVEAFLNLNTLQKERLVEVIIMSRNSPDTSLRIFNSIKAYGLDIERAALVGGGSIAPYLKAFKTDLFLSAYEDDVTKAVNSGVAAGTILTGNVPRMNNSLDPIRIAFDGDAVLFSADSERIYQHKGMDAFYRHEQMKADIPMQKGPFANFLMTLAHIQSLFADQERVPIRTALVTARSTPGHERAVKTLRSWGVRVDEAFFLGGVPKKEILGAFGAHIFFDDQRTHAEPASELLAAAVVPYREGDDPRK
ncbi:MAG: 5'-nucleotidase [Oscillospiraceae bacterium]|nr:5'-nucleotidase [Oscillospiraceae bacterium]